MQSESLVRAILLLLDEADRVQQELRDLARASDSVGHMEVHTGRLISIRHASMILQGAWDLD